MKIKRCPINFHHVISATTICKLDEWHFGAQELRNSIIHNGLYGTGPIIYQVSRRNDWDFEAEYTFHVPINTSVDIVDNSTYRYSEFMRYEDGLMLRHADLDDDIEKTYELLRLCAKEHELELKEPFYNIYLDVYGDGIIDVFAPIIVEENND
ncbi:DUF5085 domain-containing protein [Aquibacillus kalidii]|uniref:DUF5085 domain-containing protein n=1 Tax=Aquibacillus kalidii TaxID=2762597 RepID=UPI001648A2EF|nr:DUF5085 domain-containing protein [Aquibacillus kalidii]